jgi:hypothetical protein
MKHRAWLIVDRHGNPVQGIRNVYDDEAGARHLLAAWADQDMSWTPVEITWEFKPKKEGRK